MPHRDLNVLAAARLAADMVNTLIDHSRRGLLYAPQMRRSVQSIGANIAEAFGRGDGRDRAHSLRIARGESEETIQHLSTNYRAERMSSKEYWPIYNLLVTIVKMLNSLLRS